MDLAAETPRSRLVASNRTLALIACGVAVLLYLRSAWFEFVYDDQFQVLDDPIIRSLKELPAYFAHPVRWTGYYRPVFTSWLGLNFAAFGTHPLGWHLMSVLLNAAVVGLVFLAARSLTGEPWSAAIAALVFSVHPVHIESVVWVSGVTDVLLALFFVAAFLCYLRAVEDAQRRLRWLATSLVLLTLALSSKEPAATFAGVVFAHALLYNDGKLSRRIRNAFVFAVPFAVVTIVYLWIRRFVVEAVVPVRSDVSFGTMLLTMPSLLWFYIEKLICPLGISLFYSKGYVTRVFGTSFLVHSMLVLVVLAVVMYWAKRNTAEQPTIAFGAAWFLITLAPAFYLRSFENNELVHVRYLYLPSVGFCLLIGIGIREWVSRGPRWRAEVSVGVIVLLAVLNFVQQPYWANDYALYKRAVEIAPQHTTALNNLARVYIDRGELNRAEPILREVRQLDPDYGHGLVEYNLGSIAYREGRNAEAELELRNAVARNGGDSFFHLYLGLTLFREQRLDEAEMEMRQAIALTPNRPGYHLALSAVLQARKDLPGALDEARAEEAAAPNERVQELIESLEKQVGKLK